MTERLLKEVKTYSHSERVAILVGLIDSDGCIGWTWAKDGAFIPSIYVTQKKNMKALRFLKAHFGGSVLSNGNWVVKNMKALREFSPEWLYSDKKSWSSSRLVTSRRVDGHLLDMAMDFCNKKIHKTKEGTAVLIRLRPFLHGGNTTSSSMTIEQLCARRKLPNEVYDAAKQKTRALVADAMKEVRQKKIEIQTILTSGAFSPKNCIPPYQVVGFFLGDGGTCVVWGSRVMTTTMNWTGDRASAQALEYYSWSLHRDGVHRKAWKSKERDVSRLVLNGVDNFANRITPFFQSYPPPECEKTKLLKAILETATVLSKLKKKKRWESHDFEELSRVVHLTWSLNPSGPARKFGSPDVYLAHVKEQHKRGRYRIA